MNQSSNLSTAFQDEVANYVPVDSMISSIIRRPNWVRVANPRSKWIAELGDRFNEITSLPKGWDGYNGGPVSFNCAMFAANLIERLFVAGVPAPSLVPGSDGTLQIEWHICSFDIEIDVLAPFNVVANRYSHASGEEEEITLQNDFTDLADWIVGLRDGYLQNNLAEA